MRALGVVVLTPLLALLLTAASRHAIHTKPPPRASKPAAVVWGDRVFTQPSLLAGWLESHDRSYEAWARKHRAAARRLAKPSH